MNREALHQSVPAPPASLRLRSDCVRTRRDRGGTPATLDVLGGRHGLRQTAAVRAPRDDFPLGLMLGLDCHTLSPSPEPPHLVLGSPSTSASSATSCRLSRSGACPCLACGPTSTLPVSSIREHRQEVSNRNRSTLPKQARTLEVCAPVTPPGSPRSIGDAARTANAQRSRLSRCPERRLDGTASNATGRSPDRTPPPGMPPAGINEEQEST